MFHELNYLWINYFWSSDKGNGPEAIQQTVIYAVAAVIFIPPVRHFIKREFEKVHHKIDHVMSGGTMETYVEPEWKEFEHWIATGFKWLIKPFRKKVS